MDKGMWIYAKFFVWLMVDSGMGIILLFVAWLKFGELPFAITGVVVGSCAVWRIALFVHRLNNLPPVKRPALTPDSTSESN